MKKQVKKLIAMASAVLMLGGAMGGLVACGGDNSDPFILVKPDDPEKVTYNTYTSVMPSNWNELTYQDNNDTQILNYITTELFTYDLEFDESKGGKFTADGKVNVDAIVDNGFTVKYGAAIGLEDVTASVAEKWGYEADDAGYAWKITLRQDLKWDDGTPIKADDFIYSMQEQLNPLFKNYRASTYYSAVSVINARDYVYQGSKGNGSGLEYGTSYEADKDTMTFNFDTFVDYYNDQTGAGVSAIDLLIGYGFFDEEEVEDAEAFLDEWTGKSIADCLADTGIMKDFLEWWEGAPISAWTDEEYDDLLSVTYVAYEYPEMDFADVGFYKAGEYELVICFNDPYEFLTEDGELSYLAAYNLSTLPLVKKDLYEQCKQTPTTSNALYTTTYNTSLATTASFGPYKLVSFQSGKEYTLEKNEYWYGYALDDYKDQYLVDKISCQKIDQTNTAWMAFLAGCVDDIGIDITHANDYKNSKYAYFTPDSYTFSMHLLADLDSLKESGRNNGILAILDFRKALSLGINRDDYNSKTTTAHQSGYGLLNSTYYYDVVNNGIYRESDQAKKALLRAYGYTENTDGTWSLESSSQIKNYTLDAAYATLKGYDLTQAKELVESAYEELVANASYYGYDSSKKIQIKYGTSADTDSTRLQFNYLQDMLAELVKGTSLEGKIELVFDASFGTKWADDFIAGNYELCMGAWGGAVFDPGYMLECYLNADNVSFTPYWDTETETKTFTMPEGDYDGAGETITMTLMNWYRCLNNKALDTDSGKYRWGSGSVDDEVRLEIIAMLEEVILSKYYSIPTTSYNSSTLLGAKFSYATDNYTMFNGYGGIRYIRVNYNDGEWYDFVVKDNNRDLSTEYKKTN